MASEDESSSFEHISRSEVQDGGQATSAVSHSAVHSEANVTSTSAGFSDCSNLSAILGATSQPQSAGDFSSLSFVQIPSPGHSQLQAESPRMPGSGSEPGTLVEDTVSADTGTGLISTSSDAHGQGKKGSGVPDDPLESPSGDQSGTVTIADISSADKPQASMESSGRRSVTDIVQKFESFSVVSPSTTETQDELSSSERRPQALPESAHGLKPQSGTHRAFTPSPQYQQHQQAQQVGASHSSFAYYPQPASQRWPSPQVHRPRQPGTVPSASTQQYPEQYSTQTFGMPHPATRTFSSQSFYGSSGFSSSGNYGPRGPSPPTGQHYGPHGGSIAPQGPQSLASVAEGAQVHGPLPSQEGGVQQATGWSHPALGRGALSSAYPQPQKSEHGPSVTKRAPTGTATVTVQGVSPDTDLEKLEMHFESRKRSGGDDTAKIQDHRSEGFVLVTYDSCEVAQRVLSRTKGHDVDNTKLTVSPFQPATKVKVSGLVHGVSEDLLQIYFDTEKSGTDGGHVEDVHLDQEKGEAIITFSCPEDVPRVLSKDHVIKGSEVTLSLPTTSISPSAAETTAATATSPTPAGRTSTTSTRPTGSASATATGRPSAGREPAPVTAEDDTLPAPNTIEVRGVSRSTSVETLQNYFENRHRSGGGPVSAVDCDPEAHAAKITFHNAKDAASTAERRHTLDGSTLTVRLYHPPKMMPNAVLLLDLPEVQSREELQDFVEASVRDSDVDNILFGEEEKISALVIFKNNIDFAQVEKSLTRRLYKRTRLTVRQVPASCTILVSDLPRNPPVSADSLRDYFENTRRSGGCDVMDIKMESSGDMATVTFADAEVAASVAGRTHTYQRQTLSVRLYFECLGPSGGLDEPSLKLPDPVVISNEDRTKISICQLIPDFKAELDSVLNQHHAVLDRDVVPGQLALVCCITTEIAGARQKVKTWSSDVMRAVQDYLQNLETKVQTVPREVFTETAGRLEQVTTGAAAGVHYDRQRGQLSVVWNKATGRHAFNDVENAVCDAQQKFERQQNEKLEEIPATRGQQQLLTKDKHYQDILKKFPELKATFDGERGCIELRGLDKEIQPVKELILRAFKAYNSLTHQWPVDLASALQKIPKAEGVIRSACLEHDKDGVVELSSTGFTVHSQNAEKAQKMMYAGMNAGRIWVIKLGDGKDKSCQLQLWKDLKCEVQERNKDRILITEDQHQVVIAGVGPAVEADYRRMKEFLEEHSCQEYRHKMSKAECELFQFFLRDPEAHERSLLGVEIGFEVNTSDMVVRGSKRDVEEAKKAVAAFKRKLICEEREFTEPSMRELLKLPDWRRQCLDIEQRLHCKILEPMVVSDVQGAVGGFSLGDMFDWEVPGSRSTDPLLPKTEGKQSQRSDGGGSRPGCQIRPNVPVKPRIFLNPMSDITKEEHEVLVNSANIHLRLERGQVSRDLLRVGGQEIQTECRTKYPNGIKMGDIAITGPGQRKARAKLMCKKLFHCCLPETKDKAVMKTVVKEAVKKCLTKMEELGLKSIGFPALGTGTLKYSPELVAQTMYETVLDYGRQHPNTCISDVVFILHKKPEDAAIRQAFEAEDNKYKQQIKDSLQPALDNHFGRTKHRVRVTILAYRPEAVDQAVQALLAAYRERVLSLRMDVPHLDQWDDLHISTLRHACEIVNVDLTLNHTLGRIELRGFCHNLDRIPLHNTLRDAGEAVAERQNAELLARQVQWSRVEVMTTGERLVAYDVSSNYKLETGYSEGKKSVVIKHMLDGIPDVYNVNFMKLEELPEDPAKAEKATPIRVIRKDMIEDLAVDTQLPKSWSDMGSSLLDCVTLRPASLEYTQVEESFKRSVSQPAAQIVKIDRVQNVTLYRQYMAKKQQIQHGMPAGHHCERDQLWHGTKEEAADSIIQHGFNRSYCDLSKSAYGLGVYFAKTAEYSSRDEYAKTNSAGERNMFRCKVLVGRCGKGEREVRFPPKGFDSTVNDPDDPTIFVVFHDGQAYPEYRIVFKDQ